MTIPEQYWTHFRDVLTTFIDSKNAAAAPPAVTDSSKAAPAVTDGSEAALADDNAVTTAPDPPAAEVPTANGN